MQATQILSKEHRVIERVITALFSAAQQIGAGENVSPEFFIDAAIFIRDFADGCHHRKEENVLFKTMAENGMPIQDGPIGVMLYEHELGRQYTRAMRAAAEEWSAGDQDAQARVIENALGYAGLLRQHIAKEDAVLFPMADRIIPLDEHGTVLEQFAKVDSDKAAYIEYLEQADRLSALGAPRQNP